MHASPMMPLLYRDLVPWYRLLDPYEEHLDEAECFAENFSRIVLPAQPTLLELGAGAGNNAVHLAKRFSCTLVDLSPDMVRLSRELVPQCEHFVGDMRTVRLERTFDAVLVHDAIVYMTNKADLRAAVQTAYVHTRPGGAAIFAPDCVRETFRDHTEFFEANDATRAMRGIEWSWDPDPDDDMTVAEYVFVLRDGTDVKSYHDRHFEGVFPRATWIEILQEAGYSVDLMPRPIGDGEFDEVFFCTR